MAPSQGEDDSILVAGGGPAGCIAAIELVALGHRVRLITAPRRRPPVEGLSERVLHALEASGCTRARAAVGPEVRREAAWNGAASAANREWVVDRARFDGALLEDARRAGVEVRPGRVTGIGRAAHGWRLETADGPPACGRYLIEARGRRAPGRRRRGPPTMALGRAFAGAPVRPRTAVAGLPDGWAWLASTGGGIAVLQFMVSSEALPKRPALAALFEHLVAELPEAAAWLGAGRAASAVAARHAEASRSEAPIGDGMIRVGDAALAMDPLSGHGVFEAMGSAKAAAPVVNTILRQPADAALARAFYDERVRLAFARFARVGRDFYALERRWPEAPFWRARRLWPDDQPAHEPLDARLPEVVERPVIEDGLIVRRAVIVTADHPRGVWRVAGVPLAELLAWHRSAAHPPDGLTEAAAGHFACPVEQIATALAWLHHRRLIPGVVK